MILKSVPRVLVYPKTLVPASAPKFSVKQSIKNTRDRQVKLARFFI